MATETQLLLDLTAEGTGTVNSRSVTPLGGAIGVALDVTAETGTPTLNVEIQWSGDGITWASAATPQVFSTDISTVTQEILRFDCQAALFRVQAVIAGTTPTFTFTVNVTHFN